MTFRLVEDPDAVSALAGEVSDRTGLPLTHVEKDFWVTEVLRGVVDRAADRNVEIVFKGGTSLSKAFSLIERFSEDVDLLVILPDDTTGARDRILKDLIDGASQATGLDPQVVGDATSKGLKRGARFHYATSSQTTDLSSGVFLELGSRGGAIPAPPLPVTSLLAKHAARQLADAVEVAPFDVRVQAPWRTLVEKLVLLHTAHSLDDPTEAVRGARHFYDVHRLLDRPEIIAGLAELGVGTLARDVCTYSEAAGMAAVPRPRAGFVESPAFNDGPHVAAVRAEYENRVLQQLVWPAADRPTFDDCVQAVHRHRDQL